MREEHGQTQWTVKKKTTLIYYLHEYLLSFIIQSLEYMLSENDSGYWRTRTFAPAQWEAAALWLFVVRCHTKCCSNAHTKSIISFSLFKVFLDELLSFVRREIIISSISCDGPLAMHICARRERTRDTTNVSKFRLLKGKGIILLIKSALIHWISRLCFHPPTILQEISFIVPRCVDSGS